VEGPLFLIESWTLWYVTPEDFHELPRRVAMSKLHAVEGMHASLFNRKVADWALLMVYPKVTELEEAGRAPFWYCHAGNEYRLVDPET